MPNRTHATQRRPHSAGLESRPVSTPSRQSLPTDPVWRQAAAVLWWPVNAVQALFTLCWTLPGLLIAYVIHAVTRSQKLPLALARRIWAPGLMFGAGARLRVEGADQVDWSRPQVLVANHQSMIDIPALFRTSPVPLRFVLKEELTRVPFLGWYIRAMGMIGIARGDGRKARASIEQAAELVRGGATLVAFPEGTRKPEGLPSPFKGGAFQIAIAAGCPVLPVAIQGSGSVLQPGGFKVRPGTITLRFGEAIETAGLQPGDRQALARQAHEAVTSLMGGTA
ncbi:hypothetical protein B1808_09810 [Pseudofulvimonas gallinarii]|nr:hypothetical protein B1808_09810 [Pseudofulvimonas gallinarii]